MNRRLVALFIVTLAFKSTNVFAAFEVALFSKTGNYTYVDPNTIRKNGNKVTMWTMTDYKKEEVFENKAVKSQKSFYEYECKKKQMRLLISTFHSEHIGGGEIVMTIPQEQDITPVPSGSTGEVMWKIACGLLAPH